MALTATIYNFDVQLSDVDRGVYETLSFKAAQQPSETDEYLIARALAYCLEYREGISFSTGLADPSQPAISVRDLTGAIKVWIEIGAPDADRLHKASKACPRVVVYTHKDAARLVSQLGGARIHRRETIEVVAIDRELIAGLVARLDRRMAIGLSVTEGHVYAIVGDDTIEGVLTRYSLAE
jgi:uncharacterized protein YaeQ